MCEKNNFSLFVFEMNNFLPFYYSTTAFSLFFYSYLEMYKKDDDKQKATQKRDRVSFNETFLTESRAHPV
jgi:hypothetical protein